MQPTITDILCLIDMNVSPAETAGPTEMLFGGLKNHVLGRSLDTLREGHLSGVHTLACPELPAVNILHLNHEGIQLCGLWLPVL